MLRRHTLYALLRDWAFQIHQELETNGYGSTTVTSRVMDYGPDGACIKSTTIPIPSYWPKQEIRKVNDEIFSLPTKYRNAIVCKWVLGVDRPAEASKLLDCAYNTAYKRMLDAEDRLLNNLNY